MPGRRCGDRRRFLHRVPVLSAGPARAPHVIPDSAAGWSVSMSAPDRYQAIVIGSGQGGTPLCQALAAAGLPTALIERAHVGGTCVNEGCTPTKTMIASGRVAYLARRGAEYGVHTGSITVDMSRVR